MIRKKILESAIKLTCSDRNETYGDPSIQVALGARWFREFMNHSQGKYSDYHNGAIEDVFQKLARIACGKYKADNYEDGCAYFAMAGEAAAMQKSELDATAED